MRGLDVVINGQRYIPAPDPCENPAVLDFQWSFPDAGGIMSIRGYLRALLRELWDRGENFNGKYAFGNSCWELDLYAALVACGAIPGELNEYGRLKELLAKDVEAKANELVFGLIDEMCGVHQ